MNNWIWFEFRELRWVHIYVLLRTLCLLLSAKESYSMWNVSYRFYTIQKSYKYRILFSNIYVWSNILNYPIHICMLPQFSITKYIRDKCLAQKRSCAKFTGIYVLKWEKYSNIISTFFFAKMKSMFLNIYCIIYTQYDVEISLVQWRIFIMWGWHMKYCCNFPTKLYTSNVDQKTRSILQNLLVLLLLWNFTLFYRIFKTCLKLSLCIVIIDFKPILSFISESNFF